VPEVCLASVLGGDGMVDPLVFLNGVWLFTAGEEVLEGSA
jgi:hypothetical protein